MLYDHTGILGLCDSSYNFYYAKKDAQGNISALLDGNGEVVVKYKYDAWGKCKVLNPNGTENTSATFIGNVNPFRYRGYYFDTNTGLYYLKSRFYDPETGRFLNADTIDYLEPDTVNGLNLYAYCRNNPVMCSDESGHSAKGLFAQFFTSLWSYISMAVVSIWDEEVRQDMAAIQWNPFNTNESAVLSSNKVSFYQGVPVFKTSLQRSGSFGAVFLNQHATETTLKHEFGHSVQQMIMGPVKFGLMIGLPSWQNWSKRSYYNRPWEVTADIFGGVTDRTHTQQDINRGYWYLAVSSLFGLVGYFFLIGEYQ